MRIQVYLYAFENRAGNLITGISRTNRMDAHSGQYIPCRHLPNIFVSAQSQNIVTISFITNLSRPLLCQPRARRVIEKEWYMMVWFIRMIIIIIPQKILRNIGKELFQFRIKLLLSSHQRFHSVNIMRDKPTLLERIAFRSTLILCRTTSPRQPASTLHAGTEPLHAVAPHIPVSFGTLFIFSCFFLFAQGTHELS